MMKSLLNACIALGAGITAGVASAAGPVPELTAFARADLHPVIQSAAHYTANLSEARTVFALCATGRVAAPNLEACHNANEAVLGEALRVFRGTRIVDGGAIPAF